MKRLIQSAVISLSLVCTSVPAVAAEVSMPDGSTLAAALGKHRIASKSSVYIVRLAENPAVAYDGDIRGYQATRPAQNSKLDPNSGKVKRYQNYLKGRHAEVLAAVGGGDPIYNYTNAYNGFAAVLTSRQATQLRQHPGVITVAADELLKLDTVSTPAMLQLESGIWDELGGVGAAGEDVIVGIIDSGIWPESASFSDKTDLSDSPGNSGESKLAYGPPPADWHGVCRSGQNWSQHDCNNKLIGANWFVDGFTAHGKSHLFKYEFLSARDFDGHGSHTTSTAAGNSGVSVSVGGVNAGTASGMAPRARVAAYKVCWGTGGEGGCFGSDSVAAIDQAVADGVDVLNYSISGSRTSSLDQVEVAFLFAADAGVFVAASAGNEGPGAGTVAHNSPWLTTVAAGSHDRGFEATVATGAGDVFDGVSLGDGAGPADLVYSGDVVAAGADPGEGTLCYPGTLNPAAVSGRIVLCDRGVIARVDKSLAVAQAGGIGMILANVTPSSLNADFHTIPTVHVNEIDGADLRAYAQTAGASATLSAGVQIVAEASEVAAFSSRGPALAGNGDLLKPDIMAPGVDVIAAVSSAGNNGENFGALSGTSMSSPHMAGIGALMKQLHPDWSPMAIKSALMTTATRQTNQGNAIAGDAFGYGSGFVQPNAATDPGLVYDAGFTDWLGFLCGTGELVAGFCTALKIDPSDLNYPSIAVGSLAGQQTVTRTVTNVGDAGTYYSSVEGLDDIDVLIEPGVLSLAAGESASYDVTFTNIAAPLGVWAMGGISWSDGSHNVRSAVALRPVELAAPAEVLGSGASGSQAFNVTFGYTGDYGVDVHGLTAAGTEAGTVVDDPANDINTALASGLGITVHVVASTPGAALQRISLFDEYTDGNDDLDLYVFDAGGNFVGASGSGSSAEQVDVVNPTSPVYFAVVHGWQTDGADSNYTLFSWSPSGDAGNMTVSTPAGAVLGVTDVVNVNWSGLDAEKYLGVLSHKKDANEIGQTVINIQND